MAGLLLSGNAVFSSMAIGTMLVVAVAVLGSLDRAARACSPCWVTRSTGRGCRCVHRLRRSTARAAVLAGRDARSCWPSRWCRSWSPALRCWRSPLPALGMTLGERGAELAAALDPDHAARTTR